MHLFHPENVGTLYTAAWSRVEASSENHVKLRLFAFGTPIA
jgi:hypothetical protein